MDISYFFCPEHAQENFSFCFVKEKKNGVHHAGQPPGQAKRAARAHICRRIYIRSAPMDGWMDACMRYVDGCPCAALLLQSPAPATKTSDDHTSQQLIHLVWSVVALHPSLLVRKTGHRIAQVQTRGTSHASQALSITAVRPRRRVTSTPD
jgi:hypothetical protein